MNDILTINTDDEVVKEIDIKPLPLYGEEYPMLRMLMPTFDVSTLPNSDTTNLIRRLRMTMKLYGGIGLSANQCGVMKRLFIIGTDDFMLTCINPKVIRHSSENLKDREGCLSFPGMYLTVDRPKSIDVEFVNENGVLQQMTLDGITARCFLHELDHMNGVRFVDRVGPVAMKLARQKQQKLIKQTKRGKK